MPILLVLLFCKVCGQNKNYTFSEIGWTINFTSNLDSKDTMKLFESGSNKSIDIYGDDRTNLVRFSVIHFDTNPDSNRRVLNDAAKNLMYFSHLPSSNKSKIDTASLNEKIGGIRFEKFHSILTLDKNNKSTILFYSKL
jgi:hypothetical protein